MASGNRSEFLCAARNARDIQHRFSTACEIVVDVSPPTTSCDYCKLCCVIRPQRDSTHLQRTKPRIVYPAFLPSSPVVVAILVHVSSLLFFFFFGRVHEGATLSTATARLFLAGDAAAYFRAGAEHQTNERAEPASAGETSNSSLISLPPCARAQALIHCSVVEAAIVVGQYLNRVICPPPSISLIREEESSSRSLL